jgi:hypothetical protein
MADAEADTPKTERSLADLLENWRERDLDALRTEWGRHASRWLSEKWGADHSCPYCNHNEWHVQTEPVAVQSWISTRALPSVQVICGNCGQFVLVAAQSVRLVEDD